MSGATGAKAATVRHRRDRAAEGRTTRPRGPHVHHGFEECIYVVSGHGTTETEEGDLPVGPGDMRPRLAGRTACDAQHRRDAARPPLLLPGSGDRPADARIFNLGRSESGTMNNSVVCLRPKADFTRVGIEPPTAFSIAYCGPADADLADRLREAEALVIPAVGPKLPAALFAGTKLRLVQVTGAGRRPARPRGTRGGRHSGRQCAGRQQRRPGGIHRHLRVDAAAALRLVERRDPPGQLFVVPGASPRRQCRRTGRPSRRHRRPRHHRHGRRRGVPERGRPHRLLRPGAARSGRRGAAGGEEHDARSAPGGIRRRVAPRSADRRDPQPDRRRGARVR